MSRRESGCSSRGTILGSTIGRIVPNSRGTPAKPLMSSDLARNSSCARMAPMTRAAMVLALLLAAATPSFADDPLARARLLYNEHQFEEAVAAAEQARAIPARADAPDLAAARAYLGRYRGSGTPADLTNARDRVGRPDPTRFPPRTRP